MKRHLLATFTLCLVALSVYGQQKPIKIAKQANIFHYQRYEYGSKVDTSYLNVKADAHGKYIIAELQQSFGNTIPGYAVETIVADVRCDSLFTIATFPDGECYCVASQPNNIKFDTLQVGGLTRYRCSINSNTLDFYVQPHPRRLSPLPQYGCFDGLLVSFWRNGQCRLLLTHGETIKVSEITLPLKVQRVSALQLSQIKSERTIITTRLFDSVQLCWGKESSVVAGDYRTATPYDSVLHFAGGTLVLKRVQLPPLPKHYQTFVELHQQSIGDAYDRTGSLFIIPTAKGQTFLDGIFQHPDSLPLFCGRDGEKYQGMARTPNYEPPIELIRFFTSFGIEHFNSRVQLDGLTWEEENYYKQEVTDLNGSLQGEVWVGVWIGNYDGGGHRVTVDLKSYPNDYSYTIEPYTTIQPLFNTCNVLEMAGQNYGKLFSGDSLTVGFTIEAGVSPRLRYLTTGHGGWGGGDEFNPKPNTILIDGEPAFIYTPWRGDCGRYREWNPVSGNAWNGLTSSDYSRSGWCPGTATQPVYFDLSHLSQGKHTMTIAIPQGDPQLGSFSHWAVSGVIVYD